MSRSSPEVEVLGDQMLVKTTRSLRLWYVRCSNEPKLWEAHEWVMTWLGAHSIPPVEFFGIGLEKGIELGWAMLRRGCAVGNKLHQCGVASVDKLTNTYRWTQNLSVYMCKRYHSRWVCFVLWNEPHNSFPTTGWLKRRADFIKWFNHLRINKNQCIYALFNSKKHTIATKCHKHLGIL